MFFKLHLANGNVVRINFISVESYSEIMENSYFCDSEKDLVGMTCIVPIGMPDDVAPYIVKETVDEIDKMVSEHYFLQEATDGSTV